MEITIEVTKWWAGLEPEPYVGDEHPGFDGRTITLHGQGSVPEPYYRREDRILDGATCRVFLRPTDSTTDEGLTGSGYWTNESGSMWAFFTVYLRRSLWEDFWLRTHHQRVSCRISFKVDKAENPTESAMAHAGEPRIEFVLE